MAREHDRTDAGALGGTQQRPQVARIDDAVENQQRRCLSQQGRWGFFGCDVWDVCMFQCVFYRIGGQRSGQRQHSLVRSGFRHALDLSSRGFSDRHARFIGKVDDLLQDPGRFKVGRKEHFPHRPSPGQQEFFHRLTPYDPLAPQIPVAPVLSRPPSGALPAHPSI